jgi:tetraacyldisaccharide 4'-kinase
VTRDDIWYGRHWVAVVLLPAALLFRSIAALRRLLYRVGIFSVFRASVPVVVVGNLTVGGTGKTPVVMALCAWLKSQGWRPGIVSRGYGGRVRGAEAVFVDNNSSADEVGDEAVLLLREAQCPVAVAPRRAAAVDLLLRKSTCNIVVTDDGLQHYALYRDVEIVVLDGVRRLGNGWCLPAGPLREPPSRLNSADFVLTTSPQSPTEYQIRRVANRLRNVRDPRRTLLLEALRGRMVHAVAGIGHPGQFFATLRDAGLDVIEHAFPDHHAFSAEDLPAGSNSLVVMTQKDAVKCEACCHGDCWYLELRAQLEERFFAALATRLAALAPRDVARGITAVCGKLRRRY